MLAEDAPSAPGKRWQIITGEYPPQPGGVSDYTRVVAGGLAAAGDEVHVWAPPCASPELADPGVIVHRLADRFGPRTLQRLGPQLAQAGDGTLLIQYEPQALGWKGMNMAFCAWLSRLRRQHRTIVMFHEVMFPLERRQPLKDNLRGLINRSMASMAARAADHIFVSTPLWAEVLRQQVGVSLKADWLPIPSTIPIISDKNKVIAIRHRFAPDGGVIVGHFSTYPEATRWMLTAVIQRILIANPQLVFILLGTFSAEFRATLGALGSSLLARIHATGTLPADDLSSYLVASDLMLQPYPDGASARRTTLIAALAHSRPILTSIGPATEGWWADSGAVALTRSDAAEFERGVHCILADPLKRLRLGEAGAALYRTRFSLDGTVRTLRAACALR